MMACCFSSCEKPEDPNNQEQPGPDNPQNPDDNKDNPTDSTEHQKPGEPSVVLVPQEHILSVPYEGGAWVFEYKIENPAEGATVSVTLEEGVDWITDMKETDPSSFNDVVSFKVAPNPGYDQRSAAITVSYSAGGNVISADMTVEQAVEPFDYEFEGISGICRYYGASDGAYEYEITIGDPDYSEKAPGGKYYVITFLGDRDAHDMLVTEGTYVVDDSGVMDKGDINPEYSSYACISAKDLMKEIEVEFISGTVEVEREGDVFTIYGYLIDKSENRHKVYYSGPLVAMEGNKQSTLFENVNARWTDMIAEVDFRGDVYGAGTNAWDIKLFTVEKTFGDPCLKIEVSTDLSIDLWSGGLVSQEFVVDPYPLDNMKNHTANTFLPGTYGLLGTVLYHSAGVAESGQVAIGNPYAPLKDGTVELTKNEDGTFDINVESHDESGYSVNIRATALEFKYADKWN